MIHLTQFAVNSIIKILQLLSNMGMPKIQRTRTSLLFTFLVTFYQDSVLTGSEMARKSSIKLVQVMQFGKFDTRETSSKFELKFLFNRSLLAVVSHYLKECKPLN